MKNSITIIALLLMILEACVSSSPTNDQANKQTSYAKINKAAWLIGSWKNSSDEGSMTETWIKINDSTFKGQTFFIQNNDTLTTEEISLAQINDTLYYIPSVSNQNEGLAVKFTLIFASTQQMIFENRGHDFPQKISYTLITADSLMAEISGTNNGVQSSQQFPMKRSK